MTGRIISGSRELTQLDMGFNTARAAAALRSAGVDRGESIGLILRNDFAFFEASLAARMIGAYPVPVNWHFTAEEAGYLLRDCGAKHLGFIEVGDRDYQALSRTPVGARPLTAWACSCPKPIPAVNLHFGQRASDANKRAVAHGQPLFEEWFPTILERHRARLRVVDLPLASVLAIRAIERALRFAVEERPDLLESEAFPEELLALLLGFLEARPA